MSVERTLIEHYAPSSDFRVMRQPIRSYGRFQLRPQFGPHILTPTPSGNAVLAHIQKQR